MRDNTLTERTATAEPQQEPLDDTIGGSINRQAKGRVVAAFQGFGWDQSKGVRTLCTAFLESAEVRDAVFRHLLNRAA